MKTFPIMLDVRGRPAVVVGGGGVGRRRAAMLCRAGAKVTLIDKDLAEEAGLEGVTVIREAYRPGHLRSAALVFACTDDRSVNARIVADARKSGSLVNAADQPADCDFFMPAVAADGDVVVAVGTGGTAPALAAMLKHRLIAALPPRIGQFADLLGEIRQELIAAIPDAARRGEIVRRLSTEEVYHAFAAAGPAAVRERLGQMLAS